MSYSIFGFLYYLRLILALVSCSHTDGDCRTLAFDTTTEGTALIGHVVKSYVVKSQGDCELKCYLEDECMSINFGPEDSGTHLCELSDSDHVLHPADLKHRHGFIYISTENLCINNPCPNSRCQTGFTDKGYRCIANQAAPQHGISCLDILQCGDSVGDGEYLIDPENGGNPLKVFCDMTTDGGGWLLVANLVMNDPLPSSPWTASKNYQEIRNYSNNRTAISRSAMNDLRRRLTFTQLRFHCSKQQRRTFHVITAANSTGEAVVQYFSGQTDDRPKACGSFVTMEDDNSQLASSCHLWGNNDTWGTESNKFRHQMYRHATYISQGYNANWVIFPSSDGKKQCDDDTNDVSTGDFWKIFVR